MSDRTLRVLGAMSHLAHLPNQDGFEFIGVTWDHREIPCVVRREHDGTHSAREVTPNMETPCFARLAGWRRVRR